MTTTLVLLAVILGLLFVLEILNALFDAIRDGLATDMARKQQTPIWLLPPLLLRYGLYVLVFIGARVSLWMHELSHAGAQFLFGGRPRVVLLKNGGYAQSTEWSSFLPLRLLHHVGSNLGRGVMSMAPILVGASILLGLLVGLTALTVGELPEVGRAVAESLSWKSIDDVAVATWRLVADARWWIWPVIVVVGLLIAPCMTPSSVDYVAARVHLLAYCAAAVACSLVARHAPGALWMVAPVSFALGVGVTLFAPKVLRAALGGTLLATGALAFALALVAWRTDHTALQALHAMLGLVGYGLALAAIVFAAFVVGFLGLSLISVRPKTLWYTLRAVPRHLIDLFLPFNTCDPCRIHYRGKCEGCGRTPNAPAEPVKKAA